jgi:predicted O-linked N-acetylglucosamine transferase (SPINDLY family)
MTSAQLFDTATDLHRRGQLPEAERLYRRVLDEEPQHANAMFLLSVIAMGQGKLADAGKLLQRAVALHPDNPAFHSNLGEVYRRLGRNDDAVQALLTALSMRPDLAEPAFNLGLVLGEMGETEMATSCLERAADFKFDSFPVQYALATALRERDLLRAVGHYQCALALNPRAVNVLVDLGNVLQKLGRTDAAIALFRRAVEIEPRFSLAHNNLGTALLEKFQTEDAIACFRRALEIDPRLSQANNNLGSAMKELGHLEDAIACFERAAEADRSDHQVHSNLVYTLSFHPGYDATAILKHATRWCEMHLAGVTASKDISDRDRTADRRLRIGYVSPDFRDHCQALFMLPVLSHHNREAFEIHCYSSTSAPDSVTERERKHVDQWHDVAALDDGALAEAIRRDRIDILVDLTMHMAHGRLRTFARKPAPVQMCWLAYPGTTGLAAIDYRLTDPFLDPPGPGDHVYTERSLRLPDTFWCYDALGGPGVSPLPALQRGFVTFGCLNNFCKINRDVLALWARVLRAMPSAKLTLLVPVGTARQETQAVFEKEGIDLGRLEFVGRRARLEYLAAYRQIDMCLDTFPYNGHTTSLDALWMGVPVITLVGKTVVGRAGLSQAMNLGMPDLVTETPDAYVERAVELAGDLTRLAEIRAGLRARMEGSPLMDAPRFVRGLEDTYRAAWRTFCEQRSSATAIRKPT